MDFQETSNILKSIISDVFDLLIKKYLSGIDENDAQRITEIKEKLAKTEKSLDENDIKVSTIRKAVRLAKELIDDLETKDK